jgi:peptide/nickel transport system substrate-binding protein
LKRNFFPFSLSLFQGIIFLILSVGCDDPTAVDSNAVFRYNEFRNITSLDPAFARNPQNIWPIQQLFNGLVQLDHNLNVVPEIAAHWEKDSLGITYTFYLKEDIFFHKADQFGPKKTRAVTAHDFVYSFDRLTDPAVGSPGGWVLQQVKSYQAIDQHTFQIQLKQTFPAFLSLLSMRYCAVVPREVVEDPRHAFRKHPYWYGAFSIQSMGRRYQISLAQKPTLL